MTRKDVYLQWGKKLISAIVWIVGGGPARKPTETISGGSGSTLREKKKEKSVPGGKKLSEDPTPEDHADIPIGAVRPAGNLKEGKGARTGWGTCLDPGEGGNCSGDPEPNRLKRVGLGGEERGISVAR